jgi:hypothetical protein
VMAPKGVHDHGEPEGRAAAGTLAGWANHAQPAVDLTD